MNYLNAYIKTFRGFSRASWLVSLTILLNALGSMLGLFISIYLHKQGYSIEAIGWVFFGFGVGSLIGGYFGGSFCDWLTPKYTCALAMLLGAVFLWGFLLSTNIIYIGILFGLVGICNSANRTSSIMLIMQGAAPSEVTRLSGFRRTFLNMGVGIAALIGGVLASIGFDWIFIVDGFLTLIGALILLFAKSIKAKVPPHEDAAVTSLVKKSIWRPFVFLCLIYFFVLAIFLQWSVTLPVYFVSVIQLNLHQLSVLFSVNCFMVLFLEVPLLTLLKNASKYRLVAVGALLQGAAFVILLFSHHEFIAVFCYIFLTFGEMLFYSNLTAILLGLTHKKQGRLMGIYMAVYAVATLAAPIIGTHIYAFSTDLLWIVLGVFAAIAMFFVFVLQYLQR